MHKHHRPRRPRLQPAVATATAAALAGGLLAASVTTATAAPSGLVGDFNGDGLADLAVGAPASEYSGAVLVHYGTAGGLGSPMTFTQDTAGIPGTAEMNDFFGTATLITDITGDGHADLVVGADGENDGNGLLTFLKGTATGITTSGAANYGPTDFGISTAGDPALGTTLTG